MAFSANLCGLPPGFFSPYFLLVCVCVHRDERCHTRVKNSPVQEGERTGGHQLGEVLVKTEINDTMQEQHRDPERGEIQSPLSSESNWSSHRLSINGLGRLIFECQRIQIKS